MGVKLLWRELEAAAQQTTLEIVALSAFLHDGEVAKANAAATIDSDEPTTSASALRNARKYGPVRRHLVLGIDASIWLFHALTLKDLGAGNAELRMLFFRLAKLYALPVLPIFVFDGPGRPIWKRNKARRGASNGSYYAFPHQAEFQQLIRLFGFGVLYAPAEAEAQLAKMNADGVVDAILTDDGDAFLFGAQIVLRNSSKTLSGSQARANRLRQNGGETESGDEEIASASQKSAPAGKSAASAGNTKGKGKGKAPSRSADEEPSDDDSASRYTLSDDSDDDDGRARKTLPSKPKDKSALQGKIDDSYTIYRTYLIFDGERSAADARLFSPRQFSHISPLHKQCDAETSIKSLDKEGLILVALLSGGDYDVQGLARCGIKTAIALARGGYGKKLLDAYKSHFEPPSHASRSSQSARPRSADPLRSWEEERVAWVKEVQQELRTNSQKLMERKATKLADAPEWDDFLKTDQALEIISSYIWPKVADVTLDQVLYHPSATPLSLQAGRQGSSGSFSSRNKNTGISSFRGESSSSAPNSSRKEARSAVAEAVCDMRRLAGYTQMLFGWEADYTLQRFASLVWDGCLVRRAISVHLYLDRLREAGRPIPKPGERPRNAPSSPTKKGSLSRNGSAASLADVTITPQARRFADFFDKSEIVRTPQHSRDGGARNAAGDDEPNGSSRLRAGDIEFLAVHSSRRHIKYGGITSELRMSYATDGLRKVVQSGVASEWAMGVGGMFPQDGLSQGGPASGSDSDDPDSVSEGGPTPRSGSNGEDDDEDELVTLSQVKRKQKAKNKSNESRTWIPKVYVADLPFFHEPGKEDASADPDLAAERSPINLIRNFEQMQRKKADKARSKASTAAAKKRAPKPSKPEVGQRSIVDFFPNSGKGKVKARVPVSKPAASSSKRREAKHDSFDSFSSESDVQPRMQRASSPVRASGSQLQIPSRINLPSSPTSASDSSIIIMSTPPSQPKNPIVAWARPRNLIPATLSVKPSHLSQPHVLSQTSSVVMASDFDELLDEASQATIIAPAPAVSQWVGIARKPSTKEASMSADSDGDEDDSLPDIFSQKYSQQSQPTRSAKPNGRRAASNSPDDSEADRAGPSKGTGPCKAALQRSPTKSSRKTKKQIHAWSSEVGGSTSKGAGNVLPQRAEVEGSKSCAITIDDSDEDDDDFGGADETFRRPASPSPLPRRVRRALPEPDESQDASFEIVGERRAGAAALPSSAILISSD
ncbi:hypothetical protein OC835_004968 [Tilletia horrida]|nr:hypothetical protein OC835_004968 [Tilletia horrida]